LDAVADKNNFRVDVRRRLLRLVIGDVFVERLEGFGQAIRWNKRKASVSARRDPDHRNLLHVTALVAGRFQSIESELRGHVFGSQVASALSSAAAFEKIVREEADVGLDVL